MPRAPLFKPLVSALRAYRAARARGVRVNEAIERQGEMMTRRRLLRAGIGALAAAPALAAGGCARRAAFRPTVAIVGAGIAGLHCAYRLRRAGIDATVYEAAERIGGRILTDHHAFPGLSCELGGEMIDSDHVIMRRLAAELGIALVDYHHDACAHPFAGFIGGRRLDDREFAQAFVPVAAQIERSLKALRHEESAPTYRDANGGEALDRMSLAAWFDAAHIDGPIRRLLESAYTAEFGLDAGDNNVLNFLLMVSNEADKPLVYGNSDERYHTLGGNDQFTRGLAERLAPEQVRFGCRLEALAHGPDGTWRLTFAEHGGVQEAHADQVVLALPFTVLRDISIGVELPPAKRRAIAELGYGDNTKLACGFTARPWRAQGDSGIVFTDLPFQNAWEPGRLVAGAAPVITAFAGGSGAVALAAGASAEQARAFVADFARIYPDARADGNVLRMVWAQQPFVRASYSAYRPGQYTAFAGAEAERVGSLHFCGEHTSTRAQGYMEGGAESGARVAAEILADAG